MRRLFSCASVATIVAPALGLLLLAYCCPAHGATSSWEALPTWEFGQSREPLATIEEEIRKSSAGDWPEIEGRLLKILSSASASRDSKRFICRWLGTVGSEKSVGPLAALLNDPDLAHPARIGLERLPYRSAGEALVEALANARGKLLLGVISSIGTKRVEQAVPELARLIGHEHEAIARAALAALGQIGGESAAEVLSSADARPGLERDLARAQVAAGNALAAAGKDKLATTMFERLMSDPAQPPALKAAVFQGLARTLPEDDRVNFLVNALKSEDALIQAAAIKAFANAGRAREIVAARLPSLQPRAQLLLLGILADAPDVQARKPLLETAKDAEPAVKSAALEALAVHGTAEDVLFIAEAATAGESPVQASAKKTLQTISGRGVDAALLRLVESGQPRVRAAVMDVLAARRMNSAMPTLVRLLKGPDTSAAAQAAKTIGEMGSTAQIQDLARVLTASRNEETRNAAQEAIKTICTRAEDKAACAAIIETELQRANTAEQRAALLPLTIYTGGEQGLGLVISGMQDADQAVRTAAFRTLVSWPDARAAEPLLRFADTNSNPAQAVVALRDGCLRLAEMEEVSANERASILKEVTRVAKRPEERRRAVSLMGQVPALDLLGFLESLAGNPELQAEAVSSAVELARGLAPVYPRQSLAALESLQRNINNPELDQKLEAGIKAVRNAGQSREGYILGWLISGPYTEKDKDHSALFDIAFAPEKDGAKVAWRPFGAPSNGILDLGSIMPGDNRVAYLSATLSSDQDQDAVLEFGSDDGLKVWLNNELVHANNAVRPCAPGQDKVKISLKKGDNRLLVKVTQGAGQWAAVARLVGTGGKPLPDVMVGAAK